MRITLVLFILFSFIQNLKVNAETIELPNPILKSPEASSFQCYGKYDISEYTGNPSINIPLYNFKCREIEFPISLTYQSGGITVDQEATWVGLGWNLAIGGCINYIPAGNDDNSYPRSALWDTYYSFFNSNPATHFVTSEKNISTKEDLMYDLHNGLGERDFYSVNILGKTFLFFINPYTNQPTIIGKGSEIYKISPIDYNNGWIIVDGDGTTFLFANKEVLLSGTGKLYTSAWYLTQIKSSIGDIVNFNYTPAENVYFLPRVYQKYDIILQTTPLATTTNALSAQYKSPGFHTENILSTHYITKGYLSSISTEDIVIDFLLNTRSDIAGGSRKLDYLVVKSKITGRVIKKYRFNYDYFIGTYIGGDYMNEASNVPSMDPYRMQRLKLLSIDEMASENIQTYSFEYYAKPLPYKTSYSTDYWGFYNGQENKVTTDDFNGSTHTFIPSPLIYYIGDTKYASYPDVIKKMSAANRLTSEEYMTAASLKRIIYPTKGYTDFIYEPHDFISDRHYPNGESVTKSIYSVADVNYAGNYGGPNIYKLFTLDEKYEGFLTVTFTGKKDDIPLKLFYNYAASVRLASVMPPFLAPYEVNLNNYKSLNDYKCEITIPVCLPANTYNLVANLPAQFGDNPGISVTATLSLTKVDVAEHSTGGGLRIKSILNYDHDGRLLEKNEYEYKNENGKTSGVLLCPKLFAEEKDIYSFVYKPGDYAFNAALYHILRLSNNVNNTSAFANMIGNTSVGYSRVLIKKIRDDGASGATILYFQNYPSMKMLSNIYLFSDAQNGNLNKKIVLNAACDTLQKIINIYSTKNNLIYKCNAVVEDFSQGLEPFYSPPIMYSGFNYTRYSIQVYPYFYDWTVLEQSVITDYKDNNAKVIVTHNYDYNTTNHAITREKTCSSIGNEIIVTENKYPMSFSTDAVFNLMVDKHILNPIVQRNKYLLLNNIEALLDRQQILYSKWDDNVFLPSAILYGNCENFLENRITFMYDSKKNIQSTIKDSLEKVVYLWSYSARYPVAKIVGLTYPEVKELLGEYFISDLSSEINNIDSYLTFIRNSLPQALVTTYTYQPLVGMTSSTDPSGLTTYYDYDDFNRLKRAYIKEKDSSGNEIEKNIQTYDYHYKNQ